MALTIITRSVLGKEVDFVVIDGDNVIPRNNLSNFDFNIFVEIEAIADEDEVTIPEAMETFVLKNGRTAAEVYSNFIVDVDEYVNKLQRAAVSGNIYNVVDGILDSISDLDDRVTALETAP